MESNTLIRSSIIIKVASGILIGAFTAVPSLVLAQDTTDEDGISHEKLLERFDHNGDGRIDDVERRHMRDVRNRLDRNRPDRPRPDVDRPDRPRPDVDRPDHPRRDRIRDHFDRNDNDRLNPGERRHLRQFHDRLDRNDDGRIGTREKQAFRRHRANQNQ